MYECIDQKLKFSHKNPILHKKVSFIISRSNLHLFVLYTAVVDFIVVADDDVAYVVWDKLVNNCVVAKVDVVSTLS